MQTQNSAPNRGVMLKLLTRYEHGNRSVQISVGEDGRNRYEVEGVGLFDSQEGLMEALHGGETDMTFDEYFRLGSALEVTDHVQVRGEVGDSSMLRVDGDVGEGLWSGDLVVDRDEVQAFWDEYGGRVNTLGMEDYLERLGEERERFQESLEEAFDKVLNGKVGIDLGALSERGGVKYKADEVRKLLFAGFMGKMLSRGYDPEEVLQEVYRGLLVRNNGKCPFEEGKGSFGHYVHMVISCILTNYHRKQSRRLDRESVPMADESDIGQWGAVEMGYGTEMREGLVEDDLREFLEGWSEPQAEGARKVLPYVLAGCRRGEICEELGMNEQAVSRSIACLRRAVASWAVESGMEWGVPEKFLASCS